MKTPTVRVEPFQCPECEGRGQLVFKNILPGEDFPCSTCKQTGVVWVPVKEVHIGPFLQEFGTHCNPDGIGAA